MESLIIAESHELKSIQKRLERLERQKRKIKYVKMLILILSVAIMIWLSHILGEDMFPRPEDQEKKEKYLQPPDYRMPRGKSLLSGILIPAEMWDKLWVIFLAAEQVWPGSVAKNLSIEEINTMIAILDNQHVVGDGTYHPAFCSNLRLIDLAWHMSIYGGPEGREENTVMRIFPNGEGISPESAIKNFGLPRLDEKRDAVRHLVYGNVDLLYDKDGKYLGVVFVFVRPENL